jgi:hypothetical protein
MSWFKKWILIVSLVYLGSALYMIFGRIPRKNLEISEIQNERLDMEEIINTKYQQFFKDNEPLFNWRE